VWTNTWYDVLGNELDYYQTNEPFCLLGICNYVIANGVYAYDRSDYLSTIISCYSLSHIKISCRQIIRSVIRRSSMCNYIVTKSK
jgi:hypothetical protein